MKDDDWIRADTMLEFAYKCIVIGAIFVCIVAIIALN